MYTYFRTARPRQALLVEAPALVVAMMVAEFFYKFHSFTLECLAFLATWLVINTTLSFITGRCAPDAECRRT